MCISKLLPKFKRYIPYARHYNPWFVCFSPIFGDHFFVFQGFFLENYVLMYDLYSRAGYDGMHTLLLFECLLTKTSSNSATVKFETLLCQLRMKKQKRSKPTQWEFFRWFILICCLNKFTYLIDCIAEFSRHFPLRCIGFLLIPDFSRSIFLQLINLCSSFKGIC